ncbi:ATP-binding protein [Reyranella sp.]|uniref:ATP-binding protein n=1 Tax=Reyranella sp. TaxID=1929291 RepID=UPI00378529AE
MRFCGNCGSALQPATAIEGPSERRHVTVAFCDLVASTALAQQIDPEDFGAVILQFRNIIAEAVHRYGGQMVKFLGDGAMLCFGYPTAHEDDTVNAVKCAHRIVDALKLIDLGELKPINWAPAARVGIHTGLTLVGDLGTGELNDRGTLIGEVPNLAARIQQRAPSNGVVLSSFTHRLVERRIECRSLGTVELPGVRDPIALYESLGARAELDDPLHFRGALPAPPIGRDAEYNLIVSRWELAYSGNGQIGMVIAEAGMGKTHLMRAVAARAQQANARILVASCQRETSGSVLHPIAAMLRKELGLADVSGEWAIEAIHAAMERLGGDESTSVAVATLLSFTEPEGTTLLSTSVNRARAFALIAEWIVSTGDDRATLFVVEDLHLADPSTLEFLGRMTGHVAGAPCLLLATARPDVPSLWDHRSHGFTLHLGRLPTLSVSRLIDEFADGNALPETTVRRITQRSDGVPLYIEEITKAVVEHLRGSASRAGTPELVIPPTLQELLLSRLDRLGNAKPVAQLASCLGFEFPGELLFALRDDDSARLRDMIEILVRAEIMIRHGVGSGAHFSFRHGLFQEIAYNSLLRSQRHAWHAEIAHLISSRYPELAEKSPENLARHCAAGGLPELAIQHWRKAAHLAYSSSGFVEAVEFLRSALEQLPEIAAASTHDGYELALQVDLGTALIATRGEASPEVERAYNRAETLLQTTDGKELSFPALRGLQTFYQVRGPLKTSHQLAQRLRQTANAAGDVILQVEALRRLGWCQFCQGHFAEARENLRRAIELYDPANAQHHIVHHSVDPTVLGRINLAWLESLAGNGEEARRQAAEAVRYAGVLGHGLSLAYGLGISAAVHQTLDELEQAERFASETQALARRRHLPYWIAFGTLMKGWSRAASGDPDGLVELDAGIAAYRASGARLFVPYGLALRAHALAAMARTGEAQGLLAEAQRDMADVGCRFVMPQVLHLSALCVAATTIDPGAIKEAFEAAFTEAADMGAGQVARAVLADGMKAGIWTSQDIAARHDHARKAPRELPLG